MPTDFLTGLVVTGVFALAAWRLGAIDLAGAVSGWAIASGIWFGLGAGGFAVLFLFVAGGSALTRLGYHRKAAIGAAEARTGRRGARNAWANGGAGLLCALAAGITGESIWAWACTGSLAAAFADTSESEIGGLVAGPTYSPLSWQRVPPGTEGAVSIAGTLAGLIAALATALLAASAGLLPVGATLPVTLGALLATVVESLTGSRWTLSNELLNVLCTVLGAASAAACWALLR